MTCEGLKGARIPDEERSSTLRAGEPMQSMQCRVRSNTGERPLTVLGEKSLDTHHIAFEVDEDVQLFLSYADDDAQALKTQEHRLQPLLHHSQPRHQIPPSMQEKDERFSGASSSARDAQRVKVSLRSP